MIGMSLRRCVESIVKGEVDYDQVEKIVSSTRVSTPEAVEELILRYRTLHWTKFPDEATEVARRLFAEGKVEQPRLQDNDHHPACCVNPEKLWVDSVDEIVWWRAFHEENPQIERLFI